VYGQGVQLIVPTASFVVKTHEEPQTPSGTRTKAFINVCTSDKLERLRMVASKGPNGRSGQQVDIPLSLSHHKKGVDGRGSVTHVWDFVVHPDTVAAARTTPGLRKLLVETVSNSGSSVA
jgi:dynein assembly factor 2